MYFFSGVSINRDGFAISKEKAQMPLEWKYRKICVKNDTHIICMFSNSSGGPIKPLCYIDGGEDGSLLKGRENGA